MLRQEVSDPFRMIATQQKLAEGEGKFALSRFGPNPKSGIDIDQPKSQSHGYHPRGHLTFAAPIFKPGSPQRAKGQQGWQRVKSLDLGVRSHFQIHQNYRQRIEPARTQ